MIRRRGRRRKSDIVNFSIETNDDHKVTFNNDKNTVDEGRDQSHIKFGSLNIVVHSVKDEDEPVYNTNVTTMKSSALLETESVQLVSTKSKRCMVRVGEKIKYPTVIYCTEESTSKSRSSANNNEGPNTAIRYDIDSATTLPKTSDVCCWWCCHKFDTQPCYAPTHYDSSRDRFKIKGNFCSWNCAKAHILTAGDHTKFRKCEYLSLLAMRLSGKYTHIRAAPPREKLTMFGGNLDIDEFRVKNNVTYTDLNCSCGLVMINNNYEENKLQKFRKVSELT